MEKIKKIKKIKLNKFNTNCCLLVLITKVYHNPILI